MDKRPVSRFCAVVIAGLALAAVGFAQKPNPEIPPVGKRIKLFNGKNFDGLEIFARDIVRDRAETTAYVTPLNSDPDRVFRVHDGMLHISGTAYGWAATTKEYRDYYLRAEVKWGEGTFAPRKDVARDSGLLYHMTGEHKYWPHAIEFQIMEGSMGDIILLQGPTVTVKGETKGRGRFDRIGKGPFKNVAGHVDPTGLEKPHGEWNVLEYVTDGNHIKYWVNGKFVNEGVATVDHGKILFQSEGAEVYFRNMELRPLKKSKNSSSVPAQTLR